MLREVGRQAAARIIPELGLESGAARRQRLHGIAVSAKAIRCPVLLVHGENDRQFPPPLCRQVAAYYQADTLTASGRVGHWGIVAGPAVDDLAPKVAAWLHDHLPAA